MDILFALSSGVLAGLALAAPLGAIGVLLVQEGIVRGVRGASPSAAAVATVDTLYCSAAVAAGALAGPIVEGWAPWPQIAGGAALIAIGTHGLLSTRPTREHGAGRAATRSGTARRRYLVFLGLTALNPATLVYFTAILAGLDQVADSLPTAIVFVVGVGLASFGWQVSLVILGAVLGRTTGPSFQSWTATVGNGLVVMLGLAILIRALW